MDLDKSLDELEIIAALLHDVSNAHGLVFNIRASKLTFNKVAKRTRAEGISFLTKTMPNLGKAFSKALAGNAPLNSAELGFKPQPGSKLPIFLGELFNEVLRPDGRPLEHPCAQCVKAIRNVLYCFYKYKLPYSDEQEQAVISQFEKTEEDLKTLSPHLQAIEASVDNSTSVYRSRFKTASQIEVAREAKRLLAEVFSLFDPKNIAPKHGPGAVATKQKLHEKYLWTNVSAKIASVYPVDEFYFVNLGHLCDRLDAFHRITDCDLPARVILVPKDSRGPRLISAEPVDFQWIQQGLQAAIVKLVESHPLTKGNVFFTDQCPNRLGALVGSRAGRYSTLDLNEASDRVSVDLVRLLFPKEVFTFLESCRTSSTELPDGRVLELRKFAPMGSALCFPILALTIWSILTAAAPNADTRERILVYGDDVIVPAGYTADAIEQLESFGLKVNRDKSCTSGLFRESCGMDAFQGIDVTPVRLKTVWSSTRRPDVYSSWIAYANSYYDRQCFTTYDTIVRKLVSVYGPIPSQDQIQSGLCLRDSSGCASGIRTRWNKHLHRREFRVLQITSPSVTKVIDGWSMLLRFFAESANGRPTESPDVLRNEGSVGPIEDLPPFSVSKYTSRGTSLLVRRWR